jgi:hypothetical protein
MIVADTMNHQTMSGRAVQEKIDEAAQTYAAFIRQGVWTLEHAHAELRNNERDLFHTAGLAKAIACFQCTADPRRG